ncbi:Carboxypeptidase S1-like protein A [Lachnellula willkommii]|uniref:Carboxypeptidase n=1 Tax=Lachnellula willkommii TaxID=215461 RepID=A0A559MMS9_9HELO|nr:Carboxypeptidase S1-like protein A [Lachnellula willkommii]
MYSSFRSLSLSFLIATAFAQYPPLSNLTTINSPVDGNITISYKQPPNGTCQTAFDTQQQYTGWVNIPGNYSTNTFFWFFGARQPTDALTIWLNGGPGSSSMLGLFTENGPCEVVELAQGKFGTIAREYGWDRGSNILYIDQPNQVGFSYDTPTNGSLDLLTSDLYTPPQVLPKSQSANTFMNGTFNTLNRNNTANTTEIAAMAIWHMLQGFLGAFPQYRPNSTAVGVHLFAESYGGKYGPAFATLWEQQNNRRLNGTISSNGTLDIKLASLGIINGCVDDLVQAPYYPAMAINNTFGYEAINPTRAELASASFTSKGGCRDLINQCRAAVGAQDPDNEGDVGVVNSLCSNAYSFCNTNIVLPYYDAARSIYDISHLLPDSFPPSTYLEYLNSADFLAAIGSPVNYTETNTQVVKAFTSTGDYERQGYVPDIAALLNAGIRVGFMYGDRDYICNWLGGEAISLAVAAQAGGSYPTLFPAAGYAPIITNTSYIGGVVRQYGNLSFSRIYDAATACPPTNQKQPLKSLHASCEIINPSVYNTTGPSNATHTTSLPASPTNTCWLRNILETCSDNQKNMIIGNEGAIINGVLYDAASDWSSPGSSATVDVVPNPSGTGSVSVLTSTQVLTGLFTATSTPSPTTKKSLATHPSALNGLLLLMFIPFLL